MRRLCTTSSAAIFSLTKSTFFRLAKRSAIMLAIVWLFPVPGGPSITKLLPPIADAIARRCVASAGRIVTVSSGGASSSTSDSEMGSNSKLSSASLPNASPRTSALAMTASSLSMMSLRIGSFWNEKVESRTVGMTFQPRDRTWATIESKSVEGVRSSSSAGSLSATSKSASSLTSRAGLNRCSSSASESR